MKKGIVACLLLAAVFAGREALAGEAAGGFDIASADYLTDHGISPELLRTKDGKVVTIALQEYPAMRWTRSLGPYSKFVVETLRALGDTNAVYKGSGSLQVSGGERKILVDVVATFREQLKLRGLQLRIITLDRNVAENRDARGDVNSDHLIGFAADADVTALPCSTSAGRSECEKLTRTPLEEQLRIIEAALVSGAQQLNLYGVQRSEGPGQAIHIGVSPFRNGARGEMLGNVPVEGLRRIGYGSAQKGKPGTLSPAAARYVGFDGTKMQDVFNALLHAPPPHGYEGIYNAVREHDLEKLKAVM